MKNTFLILLVSATALYLRAAETLQCNSGSSSQDNMLTQLRDAKKNSPVTKIINEKYKLDQVSTEAGVTPCSDCHQSNNPFVFLSALLPLKKAPVEKAPQLLFKQECLEQSNKSKASTAQVTCPDGKRSKSNDLCMNSDFLKYQNAVITSFYSCMQSLKIETFDPLSLFEMYSLETGFKPQYSYSGGLGMGQLTGIFVEDIHKEHRGKRFMKQVANSTDADCDAAKIIAAKDMKSKPPTSDYCAYIQAGEGMERNILYTLIGSATSWKRDLEPKLRTYFETHAGDSNLPEIKRLSLLNAYGPGGRAGARAAINRLSSLAPADFAARLERPMKTSGGRNLTAYTVDAKERQEQLAEANKDVHSCIN